MHLKLMQLPFVYRLERLAIALVVLAVPDARALNSAGASRPFLPLVAGKDLFSLQDDVYYFPANASPREKTVYLALRRWDIVFTGDHLNTSASLVDEENVNRLIPGPFNHILVYLGKDSRGIAYGAELTTASFDDPGGLRIICLGADLGTIRDPLQGDLFNRKIMTRRWAMRFREDVLAQIREAESLLLSRIQADIVMGFPYQFEFTHSGSLFDRYVHLIDDGFEGGTGCSDYWTTLLEEYAGVCLKNVRMSVDEFVAYFMTDPEGMLAYAPEEISPFSDPLTIKTILGMGYQAVADAPHVFPCDGSEETGLVLPSLIMASPDLEEIPELRLPVRIPWFYLRP